MEENRKCEICGHDDLETNVFASGLVPISFNYCRICGELEALPKFLLEDGIIIGLYYDKKTDTYKQSMTHETFPLELMNGMIFQTRSEFARFLKEKEGKRKNNEKSKNNGDVC